ncbi:helix-turn-helix domain-containing protein [Streptomyces avidinii]|uniref:AcrR family transcriptional regulator n=1 Tax=Streptomyces avidinii TaxID=1895 RepID=A0ABS4KY05_STRAV|nr:helix-turn-helix domain-containing protein [Streptomyces avidinii]MBP2034361.1 AcrR family transcriptional regulator [Streptomyces avidinii]GGZ37521.1 TetR family transcriptional regulator [Streptomyces avidinii]
MVKQERAARTREALVRAAAEVFAEEGFATASIASISRRARVSAGGLHFHFASKNALARAVEDRAERALRQITAGPPAPPLPPATTADGPDTGPDTGGGVGAGGGSLQVLVDSTHALMALLAHDAVVRAGFALCADPSFGSAVDLRRRWRLWVEAVVAAAAGEGLLAEGVSHKDAAHGVVAATVGLEVLGAYDRDWLAPHTLTRFWTLMLPRLASGAALAVLRPQGSPGCGAAPPARNTESD